MEPSLDTIAFLLLFGAGQGLLLAAVLLSSRRGNRKANRILGVTLILFVTNIILHTLAHSNYLLRVPHLSKMEPVIVFLYAPLFYLYAQALVTKGFEITKIKLLHFLPALIGAFGFAPYYIQSAEEKLAHLQNDLGHPCLACTITMWLALAQLLVYIIASIKLLWDHSSHIKNTFSSIEKINLNWLRMLLGTLIFAWIVTFALQIYSETIRAASYSWLMVSAFMYLIGFMGLRQPEIFTGAEMQNKIGETAHRKRYEKSTLTSEKAGEYLEKLDALMQSEKPFLKSDLTLHGLAKKLGISSHHLSQIINEKKGQNFFEFINSHRVDKAKKLLAQKDSWEINVAEIGFEVGFSSTSAFNAAFRKHAATTPSRFRQQVKNISPQ